MPRLGLAEAMTGAPADGDAHGCRLALLEHALEDRVDVLEVIAEVELLLDLGIA